MELEPRVRTAARRTAVRAGFMLLPLVLGALALPVLLGRFRGDRRQEEPRPPEGPTPAQLAEARQTSEALGAAQRGWERAEILAPREAPGAAGGEEVLPFQGFALAVESEPAGAAVTVDGRLLGETPLMAGHACAPGAAIELVVERPPHPPQRRTLRCRVDALVRIRLPLGP